jgi:molybdopterin synthase sulfur carrier subunit
MTDVQVRYWAAAKAAAGLAEESFPYEPDLAALLDAVRARHGADGRLAEVLARCSYLVDEVSPGRRPPADVRLPEGATVDVLPPFAGGSPARDDQHSAGGSPARDDQHSAGGSPARDDEPGEGGSSPRDDRRAGGSGTPTRSRELRCA